MAKARPAPRGLPQAYIDLTEHTSVDVANAVVKHFGGTRIYVPAGLTEGHPLLVLGREMALQLIAHYAGNSIDVPALRSQGRRALVADLLQRGWSKARIARAAGITEQRVYQIQRDLPDARQLDLIEYLAQG
ncbi:helix-turn-helix domain-containing protein [Telmatospirillum sp. J64-1]|uniref:helix-turn-helix domain-containing protein n=1 Tax=Telmatospirillum sp. J64-1 TaxID=2502183 RepID=UPI00115DD4B7|nr:helix-turn-helix domain-containing protein [Telmatospirillum sp. J64-1]